MRARSAFRVLTIALGIVVLLAGCRSERRGDDGKLERITLAPREVRRAVGEAQHLTATGHYAGGTTRNLTQRVEYTSSDAAVARAPNTKGERSRIEAVGAGTATISATDPKTGISSRASGGDATVTVLGALERITLAPSGVKRIVGQTQRLTATGHYAGGVTRNLTQHLTFRSSDAGVAAVPNDDGDKSRVEKTGVGTATISAVDPKTGISSSAGGGDATFTVGAAGNPDR
jgi:uncharacterized protein YjdB